MTTRFTFDGPRARRAILERPRNEQWKPPQIGLDWLAAFTLDGDLVADLVAGAVKHGVITCPPDIEVLFSFLDGGGGEDYFQWTVAIRKPVCLTVVTHPKSMAYLGNGDTSGVRGVDDALTVLDEAVTNANSLLAGLAAYVLAVAK